LLNDNSPEDGASVGDAEGASVCLAVGWFHTGASAGALVGLGVNERVGAERVGVLVGAGTKIV
jgi:hypothetical protein